MTENERNIAIDCFHKGLSAKSTGKILGYSKTTILNLWKEHSLKHCRIPQNKIDLVLENKEKTISEIAKIVKLSKPTITKILNDYGIVKSNLNKEKIEKRNEKILEDWNKGLSKEEIANIYELSYSMINIILKENCNENNRNYTEKYYLSEAEKEVIIQNYNYKTSTEIAQELGVNRGLVTKVWYDYDLKGKGSSRQYYCNFDYFETINSSRKAY